VALFDYIHRNPHFSQGDTCYQYGWILLAARHGDEAFVVLEDVILRMEQRKNEDLNDPNLYRRIAMARLLLGQQARAETGFKRP